MSVGLDALAVWVWLDNTDTNTNNYINVRSKADK